MFYSSREQLNERSNFLPEKGGVASTRNFVTKLRFFNIVVNRIEAAGTKQLSIAKWPFLRYINLGSFRLTKNGIK